MLVIRLTRRGKKNQPFFRVVATDKRRSAKGGRAVEVLGFVDPLTKRKSLKKERILHWIKNGAKPSATVHNLLVREKIISGKKINVSKHKIVAVVSPLASALASASEKPVAEEIKKQNPIAENLEKPAEKLAEKSAEMPTMTASEIPPEAPAADSPPAPEK